MEDHQSMTAERKLYLCVQALRDVVSPVGMLRRQLRPGETLDGRGLTRLLDNPHTYRDIASECLRRIGESECDL